MPESLYIIVQTNKSLYDNRQMITRNSKREVLHYAGILASQSAMDDDIEINRIFSVDEFGNVDHHVIEFKQGKLTLEPVPREGR